jgi:hyperosmotically inducible protein
MNQDILEGKWKQLRGRVKEMWGKLTDDDLDKIDGHRDRLTGVIQAKYGYARDRVNAEIDRLCASESNEGKFAKVVSTIMAAVLFAGMTIGCATTDAGLSSKVKSKLVADDTVKAYKIDVDTRDHVVTLTGSVDRQAEKDRALQLARETKGVREVVDMISVRTAATEGNAPDTDRTGGEVLDDAAITMAVKSKLLDDPTVKGLQIDVDTREGVVYLTGTVSDATERDRAAQLAWDTKNVRDVVSNLTIGKS